MGPDSGWTWALSIVLLTMVIRTALIPLFVRQINSARNMQLLQPQGEGAATRSTATTASGSARRR